MIMKSQSKRFKIILAIITTLIALSIMYCVGIWHYSSRFLPNTTIQGIQVGNQTIEQADKTLRDGIVFPTVTLIDNDSNDESFSSFPINGHDIGMSINDDDLSHIIHEQNEGLWALSVFSGNDCTVSVPYNEDSLRNIIQSLPCVSGDERADPENAYVKYDNVTNTFVIDGGTTGTRADDGRLLSLVEEAFNNGGGGLQVSDAYSQPELTRDDPSIVGAMNTANNYAHQTILFNIDGINNAETLSHDDIVPMINVNGTSVDIDRDSVGKWLSDIGKSYDTVGTTRTFTEPWGDTVTVSGGTYGWMTDEASMVDVIINDLKDSENSTHTEDFKYKQTAAGPKGQSEWGDTYADVDISNQLVRFVQNGEVVFSANVVTGTNNDKRQTDKGVYDILDKQTDYVMTGADENGDGQPDYRTPCKYWMRIMWNGIGFHDLSSRTNWSKTAYLNGNGSHGCVNMHYDDAQKLYSLVQIGTPVIIH